MGSGGGATRQTKKETILFPFFMQLLEATQMVRHPIPRKRNAFHYLAINGLDWQFISIYFNIQGISYNDRRGWSTFIEKHFVNLNKFVFPVQCTDNSEMRWWFWNRDLGIPWNRSRLVSAFEKHMAKGSNDNKNPRRHSSVTQLLLFSCCLCDLDPLCALQATGRKSVNVNVRSFRHYYTGNIIVFSSFKKYLADTWDSGEGRQISVGFQMVENPAPDALMAPLPSLRYFHLCFPGINIFLVNPPIAVITEHFWINLECEWAWWHINYRSSAYSTPFPHCSCPFQHPPSPPSPTEVSCVDLTY